MFGRNGYKHWVLTCTNHFNFELVFCVSGESHSSYHGVKLLSEAERLCGNKLWSGIWDLDTLANLENSEVSTIFTGLIVSYNL